VNAELFLAQLFFTWEGCGLVIDRDVNAARNLLELAVGGTERHCAAEVGPSGGGCRR
jgi:transposase